jgi:hypothetical protein
MLRFFWFVCQRIARFMIFALKVLDIIEGMIYYDLDN